MIFERDELKDKIVRGKRIAQRQNDCGRRSQQNAGKVFCIENTVQHNSLTVISVQACGYSFRWPEDCFRLTWPLASALGSGQREGRSLSAPATDRIQDRFR